MPTPIKPVDAVNLALNDIQSLPFHIVSAVGIEGGVARIVVGDDWAVEFDSPNRIVNDIVNGVGLDHATPITAAFLRDAISRASMHMPFVLVTTITDPQDPGQYTWTNGSTRGVLIQVQSGDPL